MSKLVNFTLNGRARSVAIEGWEKIIDVLREDLNLTGTKRGCDDGSCGACTVVLDGKAVRSCLLSAEKLEGATVLTIEGVQRGPEPHPIQRALIDAGAVQCGYCIPGMVMSATALMENETTYDDETVREYMDGNLCRCTGYEKIWNALRRVLDRREAAAQK